MVTWFAGLFYLPRLFVYHADCSDSAGNERFKVMERKLFAIMTIGAVLATVFGLWLLSIWHWPLSERWLEVKLVFVVTLIAYHVYCAKLVREFKQDRNTHSHIFYRWFNEFPALILVIVVLLAVIRPV